jgi:density-regulated protein
VIGSTNKTDQLTQVHDMAQKDNSDVVEEKEKPGKKKKPKLKEVIISTSTRQKKKAITAVEGLDLFGVKLADAAKVCGKKYACGASVVTNPSQKEQIDIQGDVQEVLPKLLLEKYGASHGLEAKHIVLIVGKQRMNYEDY